MLKSSMSRYSLIALSLFSGSAVADSSFYVGGGLGLSTMSAAGNIINNITNKDVSLGDAKNTGFKFFGGYRLNSFFGIEGEYTSFGKFDLEEKILGKTFVGLNASASSFGVGLVGRLPLPLLSPYARVGMHRWDFEAKGTFLDQTIFSESVKGTDAYYGVGVDFTLLPLIDLGLEYSRYNFDAADMSYIAATVKFII